MSLQQNKLKFITATAFTLLFSSAFAKTIDDLKTVVNGDSAFGFDLYQKVKSKKDNLFFSPYSISTALAMTYAGARGKTQKEMARVLHFSAQPYSSFSKLQSKFDAIQNKGYVKLSVANSLWVQNGYHFLDSFLELNQKYYSAGLNFVDFALKTETARKAINTWVENKTQQKIKELIKPSMLDSSTKLVLCNAIYFKGG